MSLVYDCQEGIENALFIYLPCINGIRTKVDISSGEAFQMELKDQHSTNYNQVRKWKRLLNPKLENEVIRSALFLHKLEVLK